MSSFTLFSLQNKVTAKKLFASSFTFSEQFREIGIHVRGFYFSKSRHTKVNLENKTSGSDCGAGLLMAISPSMLIRLGHL